MVQSRDLAARFEAYGDWRRRLSAAISALHEWLVQQDLADAQVDLKVQQLLERLHQDKLVVAFVAEFSRGKSELINAIFFADFGQRLLPSSAGRTTMCPTELLYDAVAPAVDPPAADRDAPEGRDRLRIQELRRRVGDVPARPRVGRAHERGAGARVAGQARAGRARAPLRPLRRRRGGHPRVARARRRGHGRHPALAPRDHQLPASAAAAGPRHPRHAGPERDRHRARAHAQPAAQRARGAVPARRRRRRHQDRPRGVEPAPRGRRPGDQGGAPRHPEQDRRAVGRACARPPRSSAEIDRQVRSTATMLDIAPGAGVRRVGAEGAARQGQRRRRAAREEPAAACSRTRCRTS